jgi:hypothetical protein
MKDA